MATSELTLPRSLPRESAPSREQIGTLPYGIHQLLSVFAASLNKKPASGDSRLSYIVGTPWRALSAIRDARRAKKDGSVPIRSGLPGFSAASGS